MMAFSLCTALCISMLCGHSVMGVTVHFSSPGTSFFGPGYRAGVHRAVVDVDALLESSESQASEMGTDFSCAKVGNTQHNGLSVQSMSYDAAVGRTVVQITGNWGEDSTVFSDKTCTPEQSCRENSPGYRRIMTSQRTKDAGYIKPLASWNDSIYFVYAPGSEAGNEHAYYLGYRPYLQLRKIYNGFSFPTANYPDPIEVDGFSTLIVNFSVSGRWLQAGCSLIIVPRKEVKDLVFLTVVRSVVYPEVESEGTQFNYNLVAIHGEVATMLHMTTDTTQGWYSHFIESEGGVSYKDGMLCWTVADAIMCGTWSPDQPLTPPTDVKDILTRGQAAKVCKLSREGKYDNVTTGIAVVETPEKDGRLALFFGCFSTIMAEGGLGLVVKDPSRAQVDIIPVKYENKTLLAGAMFVTADDLCSVDNEVNRTTETVSWAYSKMETVSRAKQLMYAGNIFLVCLTSAMLLI